MKVHAGARAFKEGPYISDFVQPAGVSILAGCGRSVSFTRAALYDVLESMHRDYRPCHIQTFVDDIPQMHMGPEDVIIDQAIEQSIALSAKLQAEGFTISSKSTIVASSKEIATKVAEALDGHGIVITIKESGKDLGVDFGAGARRRTLVQKARFKKYQAGTRAVLRLSCQLKQARKLQVTGVRPRAWGFAAMGTTPTMAKQLRTAFGKGLGVKKAGGCLTMAFVTHGYGSMDPLIQHSLENVLFFVQAFLDQPRHQQIAMEQVWLKLRDSLEGPYRWARVKGPMGSAIATLWDWDFTPTSLGQWIDPAGHTWNIDYSSSIVASIKEVLTHHFKAKVWIETSKHRNDGIEAAPDLAPYRALRKEFRQKGQHRHLYYLDVVVQGAMDLHSERHFVVDPEGIIKCTLCQGCIGGEELWAHLCLRCPAAGGAPFQESDVALEFGLLRSQAIAEAGMNANLKAKWYRGLVPAEDPDRDELSLEYDSVSTYGTEQRIDVHSCILGGDGSGGSHSSNPRLRRCGFGLVIIKPKVDQFSFDYLGHAFGSTPGRQTVPRAEALAILHALRTTKGNALMVCDNWGVVSTYNKGPGHSKSNGLLWNAIEAARGERLRSGYGYLELVWISSHLSYESAMNQGFGHYWFIANSYADGLADRAARHYEVTPKFQDNLHKQAKDVKNTLRHHVELAILLAPAGAKPALISQVCQPSLSKLDRARQLAREAGHQLDAKEQCVLCGLRVPADRNMGFLEAVLNLKCMGSIGASYPSLKLFGTRDSEGHYLFGRVRAHATHT